MNDLYTQQRTLYDALHAQFPSAFFIKQDMSDNALWITDLPRRMDDITPVLKMLDNMGYSYMLNGDTRLLQMDMTLDAYSRLLATMPITPPQLPQSNALHGVYALCSLLLLHPVPLEKQPMQLNRRTMKLCQSDHDALLSAVQSLHEECAKRMRLKQPLPYAAGQLLAQWLLEHE